MLKTIKHKQETKKHFTEFAHFLDVVYFGAISESDEYTPAKGMTFVPRCHDLQYMSGNYDGFEITSFMRQSAVDKEDYTWSVIRIELKLPQHPHVPITSHHYPKDFYTQLHMKYPKLKNQNHLFEYTNGSFTQFFKVYSSLEDARYLPLLLPDLAMQALYMQFPRYEFEIVDGSLFVYYRGSATFMQLKEMLTAATWLTEHSEYVLAYTPSNE